VSSLEDGRGVAAAADGAVDHDAGRHRGEQPHDLVDENWSV
jgi:hypothetical protein